VAILINLPTMAGADGQAIRTDPMQALAVTSVNRTSSQRTCTPTAAPAQIVGATRRR